MTMTANKRPRNTWRWRGPENRKHSRWPCAESTCFSVNRQLHEGIFKNVSTGGTFINTRGRFQIGESIIVAGILARNGAEEKRAGKIVRVDRVGIAVEFTDRRASNNY